MRYIPQTRVGGMLLGEFSRLISVRFEAGSWKLSLSFLSLDYLVMRGVTTQQHLYNEGTKHWCLQKIKMAHQTYVSLGLFENEDTILLIARRIYL